MFLREIWCLDNGNMEGSMEELLRHSLSLSLSLSLSALRWKIQVAKKNVTSIGAQKEIDYLFVTLLFMQSSSHLLWV